MSQIVIDILVVDDDIDIRLMVQAILQYKGWLVKTCSNIDEMNRLLGSTQPKLVLMDMLLSGIDGREGCRYLKAQAATQHIPVLMISAHPDAEKSCKLAGADAFLAKPFEMDILLGKVDALLKV